MHTRYIHNIGIKVFTGKQDNIAEVTTKSRS